MTNPLRPPRPRSLAHALVAELGDRLRDGRLAAGDRLPTEGALMDEFGVSRSVVREALSRLQAAGLVETRHGIGTFAVGLGDGAPFRIAPAQLATLHDVIAVLELRIGVETEAAALAAQRRTDTHLARLRAAHAALGHAIESGRDAVAADFQFHLEIARATGNHHFSDLLVSMGTALIPRARLEPAPSPAPGPERLAYLRRVHAEHESILDAIAAQDADAARAAVRTHLANSRERRRRAAEAATAARRRTAREHVRQPKETRR